MSDIVRAVRETGWRGPIAIERTEDGHTHAKWDGRHIEGVCDEAVAEFIRADARAKAAALVEEFGGNDDD